MYDVKQIARWFIENTTDEMPTLTPLKIQKLLYYVQSWGLALYDEAFINSDFEAWAHGPVAPEIYHTLNKYRYHQIPTTEFEEYAVEIDPRTLDLLQQVHEIYGVLDAKHLESLTHQEQPWIDARGELQPEERSNNVISEDIMRSFYKAMQEETE